MMRAVKKTMVCLVLGLLSGMGAARAELPVQVKVGANVYQAFSTNLTPGTWVYLEADPTNSSPLRATQRSLGYREVDYKATMFSCLKFYAVAPTNTGAARVYDYSTNSAKKTYTVGYWADKDLPVMVGPDGNGYITDGHHTTAGYLSPVNTQAGQFVPGLNRVVLGHVVTNFYAGSVQPPDDAWWLARQAENNAFLYGTNGNQLALPADAGYAGLQPILPSGTALPITPSTLGPARMAADSYRGLAWGLADGITLAAFNGATKVVGYKKTNPDTGTDINFVEFFWADYLRNRIVWDDTKTGHALGSGFSDANAISAPLSFFAAVVNGTALARSQDYRDQYGRNLLDYTNSVTFNANTVRWATKSMANYGLAAAGDTYNLFLLDDSAIAGDIAPSPLATNILHVNTTAGMRLAGALRNIRALNINAGGSLTTSWKDAVVTNSTLTVPAGSGRVELAGSNTINGPVTVAAGTLAISGSLAMSALTVAPGAALEYALSPTSTPLAVTGNAILGGQLKVRIAALAPGAYTLATYGGTLTAAGVSLSVVSNSAFTATLDTNTAGQVRVNVLTQPWKFGVMSDTQWTGVPADAVNNPSNVPVSIINQINPQFIAAGVKFVVQVGDLTENGLAGDVDVRAAAATNLYNAGIGFFPLRGNHEAAQAAAQQVTNDFPQTQGLGPNTAGSVYAGSAAANLAGLSYAFDFNNTRMVLLDQFTRLDGTGTDANGDMVDQVPWVGATLSNRAAGTHAFVFSHKNLIGENHVDCLFGANPASNAVAQNQFIGALAGTGVRYTLSGHDHVYQRSLIASPDALAAVEEIICGSDSSKFYTPASTNGFAGQKIRETGLVQDLYRITYFLGTVDGPRFTLDYYASDETFSTGNSPAITPTLHFSKRETFGYSLNGRRFFVPQGGSYTAVVDTVAAGAAYGETYRGTTARILAGSNGSTNKDYIARAFVREVNTGWAPSALASDVLSLWGLADLATNRTDTYVLSLSYDPTAVTPQQAASGAFCLASKDAFGHWVNAVDLNLGGLRQFVAGPFDPSYTLGAYGVDTTTHTVWAVLNHASDFVATTLGDIVNFVYTSDNHYGIVRPFFRGGVNVSAQTVNEAMIAKMNTLPSLTFPNDGGVGAGQLVGHIDFLVDTGDLANRSEPQAAVGAINNVSYLGATVNYPGNAAYTAAVSSVTWAQYQHDFLGDTNTGNRAGGLLTLQDSQGRGIPIFLSPGNHDVSDAIGMLGKIPAANVDATSYVQIYNRMTPYSGKAPIATNVFSNPGDYTNINLRVNYSFDIGGVHVQSVNMFPDRQVLDWMSADLATVPASTPVFLFCHVPLNMAAGETKVFGTPTNTSSTWAGNIPFPLSGADTATSYKDMNSAKQSVADWLMAHPQVKALFSGHDNFNGATGWNGQDANGNLIAARDAAWPGVTLFRVDSPMKGDISGVSATGALAGIGMETNLSFQVYSFDLATRRLTEREYLYDNTADTNSGAWSVQTTTIGLNFPSAPAALVAPANGTVVSNGVPTLAWAPVAGASGYTVALTLPNGSNAYFHATSTSLPLAALLNNGAYSWAVTPFNGDGNGPVSATGTFNVNLAASAGKWSFGVMDDTQWTCPTDPAGVNSNMVPLSIINQLNPRFIAAGVKFVVQVGDLTENGNDADEAVRAAAAQPLLNAGIGFFPMRGNHETYASPSNSWAIPAFQSDYPQTRGLFNTFGAANFSSPTAVSSDLNGMSYAFDYGASNSTARFLVLDNWVTPSRLVAPGNGYNYGYSFGDQQTWISAQLDKNSRGAAHAFVFSHQPLIAENHQDSPFVGNTASNPAMQNAFFASLATNNVRYYISGHDHIHQRSLIASPDGSNSVEEIIGASDSSKFYTPKATNDAGWAGQKYRETSLAQELYTPGYYIYTVDGPRVSVDYFSDVRTNWASDASFPFTATSTHVTPAFNFVKKETFGYSLNGQRFFVPQGGSYTTVVDSVAAGMAYGEAYTGTTARILAGVNGSTRQDGSGRALVREISTGWAPGSAASDVLTLWGIADLGTGVTDSYTLSMSYKAAAVTLADLQAGKIGLLTRAAGGAWARAVEANSGGVPLFVFGPWNSSYGLGTYGVDTNTATAWAVINHASDFAVGALPAAATVTVLASPTNGGSVFGSGTYLVGSAVTLSAVAASNWTFAGWSDGALASSRSVVVPSYDVSYTANFRTLAASLGVALNATGFAWSTGGDAAWFPQAASAYDGVAAAQSGHIGNNQQAWFQVITNGPGSVLFWWKVSAETNDFLEFCAYSDTATQVLSRISGTVNWTQYAAFLSTTNLYTLKWRYAKNGSLAGGSDAGWVDQVAWLPCPYAAHVPQLFFQESAGLLAAWILNTNGDFQFARFPANTGNWTLKTAGDLDGDGVSDLFFQTAAGDTAGWFMNADGSVRDTHAWGNVREWGLKACADYEGLGHGQLFFQTPAGLAAYWLLDTNGVFQAAVPLGNMDTWKLRGAGDLDGDHKAELFWQNAAGQIAIWFHNPNGSIHGVVPYGTGVWALCGVLDLDGDGVSDLLWQTVDGNTACWFMNANGAARSSHSWGNQGIWKLKAAGR